MLPPACSHPKYRGYDIRFPWKRCVVGRELSAQKPAAQLAAPAPQLHRIFGKISRGCVWLVDCSSALTASAIPKIKQTDKSFFIYELPPLYLIACI
jgi:hypothetical protein